MKALVTGGCGFIGSYLVEALLLCGHEVVVLDDLSTGRVDFMPKFEKGRHHLDVRIGNCLNLNAVKQSMARCDVVFHLQANADVRHGIEATHRDMEQNAHTTWNVLEAMRIVNCNHIVFSSSAVVYGEPELIPTPEHYRGSQTSLYGASKLYCESMIEAYVNYFGFKHHIFRFVSWIGKRYSHGVIFDFVRNLTSQPEELRILGNGSQEKSYLHASDGVEGVISSLKELPAGTYNLGHDESMDVAALAAIVANEMNLTPRLLFGTGNRGWKGDSPVVKLDTGKIRTYGWKPTVPIAEGIRDTVRYLKANPGLLRRP